MKTILRIFLIVIIALGVAYLPNCGGGSSSSDGGGGGGDDGGGGGGGDVTPLAIDANKVVTITSNAPTVYALNALGFNLELGDLGLASMSMAKAIPLADITCTEGMTKTIACEAGGEVQIALDCHAVQADHCGILAVGTMAFTDCAPVAGITLEGTLNIERLIATAYQCNFEIMQMDVVLSSTDYAVNGDVQIAVDELAFAAGLASNALSITVGSGVLTTDEGTVNCVGNVAGGVDCGTAVTISEVSYCDNSALQCEVGEAGDQYCNSLYPIAGDIHFCHDGCCEGDVYQLEEFTCNRDQRECPQQDGGNYSGIFNAVQGTGDGAIPYEVPLTCVNSIWQVPCLDDSDCRLGAQCNFNYISLIDWDDYKPLFPDHGFCECAVIDLSSNEQFCGKGLHACCSDGIDNDGDCLIDCYDGDCFGALSCKSGGEPEICDDGIDNDLNLYIDCFDSYCATNPACEGGDPATRDIQCNDGLDNDGDGLTDCEEYAACSDAPNCIENCFDNSDNDGDGLVDCRDNFTCVLACNASAESARKENCTDGEDNDSDGHTDCDDHECLCDEACTPPEICDDGIDNNCNDLIDCQDSACAGPACPEICIDGRDNDGDGLVDGFDPDCATHQICTYDESVCNDGLDDDYDLLIDCADPDCSDDDACKK